MYAGVAVDFIKLRGRLRIQIRYYLLYPGCIFGRPRISDKDVKTRRLNAIMYGSIYK